MRRTSFPIPKLPPLQTFSLEGLIGVYDRAGDTRTPNGYLLEAENLQFDQGIPVVRPGVTTFGVTSSTGPLTGIDTYRLAPTSGSPLYGTETEVRHVVAYGKKSQTVDGQTFNIGALYVDKRDGAGFQDVSPLYTTTGQGYLQGVDRPAYFAQINNNLYGVNGFDGLFVWDGNGSTAGDGTLRGYVVTAPAQTAAPTLSIPTTSADPSRLTTAGTSWVSTNNANLATAAATGGITPLLGGPTASFSVWYIRPQNTSAVGEKVYFDRGAGNGVDLTEAAFKSPDLLLSAKCNKSGGNLVRFYIGKDGAAIGTINTTDWYAFEVSFENATDWHILRLSLLGVPNDILSDVRYFAFECLDSNSPDFFTLYIDAIWSPGYLTGTRAYYRARTKRRTDNVYGPVTDPVSTPLYVWPTGPLEWKNIPQGVPAQRVKLTVSRADLDANTDLEVYRAIREPIVEDAKGLVYHLIESVTFEEAGSSSAYVFYDNVPETELIVAEAMPLEDTPPSSGDDAPHYVLATDTRLLFARSDMHPNRVWASDIGKPESVPDVQLGDVGSDVVGRGGFVDVGHDDGDFIVGMIRRVDEVLIFKRRAVWRWVILAEGDPDGREEWRIARVCQPGCVAPRSICGVPGGVIWMAEDGLYFLPDNSDVPTEVPITSPIQRTIDEISQPNRRLVTCAYEPIRDLLFVGIAEAGTSRNSCLVVMDRRLRREGSPYGTWIGKWATREGATTYSSPSLLYVDYIDRDRTELYLLRGDKGRVERLMTPGLDDYPYEDYGMAIRWRLKTGWLRPSPGRRIKGIRRFLQFGHAEWEGEDNAFLSVAARLRLSTRPNTTTKEYDYYFTVAPPEESEGIQTFGTSAVADLSPDLHGEQLQVELSGAVSSNVELRVEELGIGYIDLGEVR